MTVFDDLGAEQDRLGDVLTALGDADWAIPSLAQGWTVRDVVVHLAQTEEMALARLTGAPDPAASTSPAAPTSPAVSTDRANRTVEQIMADLVATDGSSPAEALHRWQQARTGALAALTSALMAAVLLLLGLVRRASRSTVWRSFLPEVSPA